MAIGEENKKRSGDANIDYAPEKKISKPASKESTWTEVVHKTRRSSRSQKQNESNVDKVPQEKSEVTKEKLAPKKSKTENDNDSATSEEEVEQSKSSGKKMLIIKISTLEQEATGEVEAEAKVEEKEKTFSIIHTHSVIPIIKVIENIM